MDEVIGALVRGVVWLIGQAVRFLAELVAAEVAEGSAKAARRRFAGWRTRRRSGSATGVSLEKGR